jgi:hypothetical protein
LVVRNQSLSESADKNLTPNAEQMNTQGSSVAGEHALPQEGSAPLIDWPEDGHIEDVGHDAGLTNSLLQTATETPVPFGGPFQETPGQTGMEGIVPQTPLADPDVLLSLRPRPTQPSLVQQPLLMRASFQELLML